MVTFCTYVVYLALEGKATLLTNLVINPAESIIEGIENFFHLWQFYFPEFFKVISSILTLNIFSQSSPWFIATHLCFQKLESI